MTRREIPPGDGPDEAGARSNEPQRDGREDIGCLKALEIFYAYLDGELDPLSAADFEHHLEHCRSCYSRAELENLLTKRLRATAASEAPEALRRRLHILLENL